MKGVPASSLQFIYLDNAKTLDKVCKKIEKDSIFSDDTLDEKAMILEGILM
jgi:CTP:phosphocholine cytidylyltransferase-like protein